MAFELQVYDGKQAAPMSADFWQALDPKVRRFCLFDVALEGRREALKKAWLASSHVCIARENAKMLAAGWLIPMGARTACCHFIMPKTRFDITSGFILKAHQFYDCLLCLVPAPYQGALRLLTSFEPLARLPGACWLAHRQRSVDGILLIKRRGK